VCPAKGRAPQPCRLFDLENADFLAELGVPPEARDAPFAWDGWTAGMVQRAVIEMAREFEADPAEVCRQAIGELRRSQEEGRDAAATLERRAGDVRRRIQAEQGRVPRECLLPDEAVLGKVAKYEAHLSRQLYQALHELQRLQASRKGQPVPLPGALDVTVNGSGAVEPLVDGHAG
jgi:hypothetical protein